MSTHYSACLDLRQCSWTNRPIQCCDLNAVYHTASNVLSLGSQLEALFLEAKELVGHTVELADTGLGFEWYTVPGSSFCVSIHCNVRTDKGIRSVPRTMLLLCSFTDGMDCILWKHKPKQILLSLDVRYFATVMRKIHPSIELVMQGLGVEVSHSRMTRLVLKDTE